MPRNRGDLENRHCCRFPQSLRLPRDSWYATAGRDGLRFHDLRGTAATSYILAGLPLDDVATILGWELKRVKEIARRYVTGEAIGLGMIARLQETQNRRPTVKPSVKPASLRRGQKRSNAVRAVAGELGNSPVTENTNKINGATLMWGSILDRALYRVEWTE